MISKDIKDIKLADLLKLQKQIDEELNKPKEDGFIPRERVLLDRILSIDNCFQKWLQELPNEYNFITYFPKESNRTKELIKLTNILFFFLECFNSTDGEWLIEFFELDKWFDNFREGIEIKYLRKEIIDFKMELWSSDYGRAFFNWIHICKLRNFTKEEVIKTYISKYELIMKHYEIREEVEKMEMTREEKVRFIKKSAWYFEGLELKKEDFITKSDAEIDEAVEKYNYLWEK